MNTFKLIVSTPDGDAFNGEAYMLSVRGAEGSLAVMAGHIPFITTVKPGECRIDPAGEDEHDLVGFTDGGLLTVSPDAVTLLSGSFRWQTETPPGR